jgi:hypothetical protein
MIFIFSPPAHLMAINIYSGRVYRTGLPRCWLLTHHELLKTARRTTSFGPVCVSLYSPCPHRPAQVQKQAQTTRCPLLSSLLSKKNKTNKSRKTNSAGVPTLSCRHLCPTHLSASAPLFTLLCTCMHAASLFLFIFYSTPPCWLPALPVSLFSFSIPYR